MRISIQVEGEERLLRALKGAESDVTDLRSSWRPVSDEIYSITRAQFASQGGRAGSRWPPRAQSTVDRYTAINRKGFKVLNETLRRTDAMFKSLANRGAAHGIYEEEAMSLTMGTDLPYANIHQRGGGKIPQRKIFDLTDADADRLMKILKRGLTVKIADRGFDVKDDGGLPF